MVNLVELLIVLGAFGIVGVYLFVVSRFIGEAEAETKRVEGAEQWVAH